MREISTKIGDKHEGTIATTEEAIARTGVAVGPTIILPGRFVAMSTTNPSLEGRGITLPSATDSIIVGIVRAFAFLDPAGRTNANGELGYKEKDLVPYLVRCTAWLKPVTAVKNGDPVFIIIAGPDAGRVRNAADGANTIPAPNARLISIAAANEPAMLSINYS